MFLLSIVVPLAIATSDTGAPMRAFLPDTIDGWTTSEPPRIYSGKRIFEYMDGAGEVYLAYHFQTLLVQRYARKERDELLVEVFDMGTSRNAFGISTYMRGRGRSVRVGQDGEYKSGLLCFWKGQYYVCIRVENENRRATAAIFGIGRIIARAIGKDGTRPELLRSLPPGEYQNGSLRYFFRDEILRAHLTLPDGNPLRLTDSTAGLLARTKKDRSQFLIVKYPTPGEAEYGFRSFTGGYKTAMEKEGIAKSEGGTWDACEKRDEYVLIVLGAPTKHRAQEILALLRRRVP